MYTENEYEDMQFSTVPEILRSNLSSVILQLVALGINDVENFDFMSKPSEETIAASINELELLGALKKKADETISNYLNSNDQNANKKRLLSFF